MSTADDLVKQMFSWIGQKENCALKLKELAKELEKRREKFNAAECVGSSVAVVGAGCTIGAGVATLCTGGAAVPFLATLGAAYGGVGGAITGVSKFTEWFLESETMKEVKKIEERSNYTARKIQELFERLKTEVRKRNPHANFDVLDQLVISEIMRAVARQNGEDVDFSKFFSSPAGSQSSNKLFWVTAGLTAGVVGAVGIAVWFGSKHWLTVQLTTFGGATQILGGTTGLLTALPVAIKSWTEMIEKDHVTEASRSVRKTAEDILKSCREWRAQLDNIKRNLREVANTRGIRG